MDPPSVKLNAMDDDRDNLYYDHSELGYGGVASHDCNAMGYIASRCTSLYTDGTHINGDLF